MPNKNREGSLEEKLRIFKRIARRKSLEIKPGKLREPFHEPENKTSADLDKIIRVYEDVLSRVEPKIIEFYESSNSLITDRETITAFVSVLKKYEEEKYFDLTGLFLTGLINNIKEKEITLNLTNLDKLLGELGRFLRSHTLIVKGNAGNYLGQQMESGEIIVHGDVGDYTGFFMKGGNITVYGNAGDNLGSNMESGRIEVKGNGGMDIGNSMKGGDIVIYGDAKELAGISMKGGNMTIYGDVGNGLGAIMKSGRIEVKGNAGNNVGFENQGGKIIVDGDAGNAVGVFMEKGEIIIGNNAGQIVGTRMIGGTIYLNGDYISISKKKTDGEIYHKGKKIYPKSFLARLFS